MKKILLSSLLLVFAALVQFAKAQPNISPGWQVGEGSITNLNNSNINL